MAYSIARFFPLVAAALLPVLAFAQPVFDIGGLHTDLTFRAALERAEALGGTCQAKRPRRRIGGLAASCGYPSCDESSDGDICTASEAGALRFTIGGQAVRMVEFEAPGEEEPLRNASIFFEGNQEKVVQQLIADFGDPKVDTAAALAESWSHARRLMWQEGVQRASLLNMPQMILLAADRPEYEAEN